MKDKILIFSCSALPKILKSHLIIHYLVILRGIILKIDFMHNKNLKTYIPKMIMIAERTFYFLRPIGEKDNWNWNGYKILIFGLQRFQVSHRYFHVRVLENAEG